MARKVLDANLPAALQPTRVVTAWSYGDVSPVVVATLPTGKAVTSIRVAVDVAMDGTGAALSVGTAGDAEQFIEEAGIDPATVAIYGNDLAEEFGSDTDILLSITPGAGASTGSGSVIVEFE